MMGMFKYLMIIVVLIFVFIVVVVVQDVVCEDIVIFDLDCIIQDLENFNWMIDGIGICRMYGVYQMMWEFLFIFNYGIGELDFWFVIGFEVNGDLIEFIIMLWDGVIWFDGEVFNVDDVVFIVEMVKVNEELIVCEVVMFCSYVVGVEKINDLIVKFMFNVLNLWFVVENFGVCIFGFFLIMLEYIWVVQENFVIFIFYLFVGMGLYIFVLVVFNCVIWDCNDSWWGVVIGFQDLFEL